MRYVMQITNRDGLTNVSDLRTSTWEDAEGKRFRFNQSSFDNDQPSSMVSGNAQRLEGSGTIDVKVEQPAELSLNLPQGALFPVQHTIAILAAAKQQKNIFSVNLYDGSDKGDKMLFTNAAIGSDQAGARRERACRSSQRRSAARRTVVAGGDCILRAEQRPRRRDAEPGDVVPAL